MTTAYDIVRRAYRKIGVTAVDETLDADQSAEGLDALNAMMHGWALAGVDVVHADLELSDTFSLDPQFHEGAVYMLAQRLASDYMAPPTFDAEAWMRQFQTAYMAIAEVTIPGGLLKLPSQYNKRKVSRGGFESA